MKNAKSYICCALTVIAMSLAPFAQAEEQTNAVNKMVEKIEEVMKEAVNQTNSAKTDPKMEEMMKKAEVLGGPSDAHKVLEAFVGDWDVEAKCWMAADAPPQVTKGFSKAAWVMNGRFIQEEFTGEMMGKPFNGMGITGYDNMQQKYKSVWLDDMNTAIMTSEGTAEEGGKVLTFTSKMDCPMSGEKDMPIKQVIRIISNDKHTFEMFDLRKTDNNKTMELTYTRR